MAALVPAGAPVSVLIDHGLAEEIVEKLLEAGVGTVEQLGSMTPEELEAIPSVGDGVVEKILVAVNSYYAQFEPQTEAPQAVSQELESGEETAGEEAGGADAEAGFSAAAGGSESSETFEADDVNAGVEKREFDTIENSEGVR